MKEALTILIVDDNADDRLLYQRSLRKAFGDQLCVIEAESGEMAIAAVARSVPDCIMLDYSLPGQDGIQVLKRIRAGHPHLPVILLTGQGNEAVAVQSMKEGAQDYITKSVVTVEALQRMIPNAITHGAMQRRIEEQHLSLETFARALAHDLKEPVRTICSFTQLLSDGEAPKPARSKYIQYIRDAGERMAMLIDTAFVYTQLDNPSMLKTERLALAETLRTVTDNLATMIGERGAEVTYDELPSISANRIQMIQLLQNLVSNAISHSPGPVHIHVTAEREVLGVVRICVRDNGPGIAPEHQQKIFEPFRRLNHDDAHSGVGLAICRKIVELHGGRIGCTSEIGKGSIFFFTISTPAGDKASAPLAPVEPEPDPWGGPAHANLANVLLVDDMEADIYMAQTSLGEPLGMRCNFLIAEDGRDALATLRKVLSDDGMVDLILLDINMPIMDGFEMLEQMQLDASLRLIPVVMCTGSTYEKDKERAHALGALGYLEKPARFDHLKPIIDSLSHVRLKMDSDNRLSLFRTGMQNHAAE